MGRQPDASGWQPPPTSLSVSPDFASCSFVAALQHDPRPTCVLDLNQVSPTGQAVYQNPALRAIPDLYNTLIQDPTSAAASFVVDGRWKVIYASPPSSHTTQSPSPNSTHRKKSRTSINLDSDTEQLSAIHLSTLTGTARLSFETTPTPAVAPTKIPPTNGASTQTLRPRIYGDSAFTIFFRSYDWSSTEIGPIDAWPDQLVELCNLMLASPDPCAVYWGKNAIALYNEATIPIIGNRHPACMGKRMEECFPEVWEGHFKPLIENVLEKRQPWLRYNDRRVGYRDGKLEEVFWNVTFTPILSRGDEVLGTWGVLLDVTDQKFWQRRIATLLRLTASMNTSESFDAMWRAVISGFEVGDRDIPHLLVYSASDKPTTTSTSTSASSTDCQLKTALGYDSAKAPYKELEVSNHAEGLALLLQQTRLADAPLCFDRASLDLVPEFWDAFEYADPDTSCNAIVVVPIRPTQAKDVLAYMVVGLSPLIKYDQDYREFVDLARRQVSSTMASILLREEEISRSRLVAEEASHQLDIWKAEAEMHELRFTRLAETAPIGICTYAPDGSMTYANDVWYSIFGMTKDDDFSGAEWWDHMIHPEHLLMAKTMLGRLLIERQPVRFEIKTRAQPGYPSTPTEGYIWILVSAYAEPTGDGPQTVVACFTDINEQKRVEVLQNRRLQDAITAKRQQEAFIDMTSHEIRNPLSVVLQCSEEIISFCTESPFESSSANITGNPQDLNNVLDAAETIEFCALHQKRIVDDILTLSKLDSDLLPMSPDKVQPVSLVEGVMKLFEREMRKSEIEVSIRTHHTFHDCELSDVLLDPSRVSQIVINLISNAIKFTKTQTVRRLELRLGGSVNSDCPASDWPVSYLPRQQPQQKDLFRQYWPVNKTAHLHFAIIDSGVGMSDEEQQQIFSRFTQASPRTHVKYGGSGLGLYICRALSESHGGQVGCASTPGKGSVFGFHVEVGRQSDGAVPVEVKRTERMKSPPTSPESTSLEGMHNASGRVSATAEIAAAMTSKLKAPSTDKFHILVVEDNVLNQKVLRRQLEKAGHTVVVAQHGQDALDVISKTKLWTENKGAETADPAFDFVLMDIEMPVMNGLDCTQAIREYEQAGKMVGHVPIVATTGNARDEKIKLALHAGMDKVVLKPFSVSVLLPIAQKLKSQYSKS